MILSTNVALRFRTHQDLRIPKTDLPLSKSVIELRIRSGIFFASLCKLFYQEGVFQSYSDILDIPSGNVKPLEYGVSSACFLIKENNRLILLKMSTSAIMAEAEWLNTCNKFGIFVPRVYSCGYIPGQENIEEPVKYIALEGIKDRQGGPAKTGKDYEDNIPLLEKIAIQMGLELAKIHQIKLNKPFGRIADNIEFGSQQNTWAIFLAANLINFRDILFEYGVLDGEINCLVEKIYNIRFPQNGVYCHGDYGLHNSLVASTNPLVIYIIDPNPLLGDCYWDLARERNRFELKREKHLGKKEDEKYRIDWVREKIYFDNLMTSYNRATKNSTYDMRRLAANQLVQLLFTIRYEQGIDMSHMSQVEIERRNYVRMLRIKLIREKVDQLIQET